MGERWVGRGGAESYQHRLPLLRVGTADGGKVGVGVPLFGDGDGWRQGEGPEGLLDEGMADAVEGRVHDPQRTRGVCVPGRHWTHATSVLWGVWSAKGWLGVVPVETQ